MYGRIVELDTLTDTDRARTEYHDLLLVAHDRLVLLLIRRVEVGHIGRELATAGIDHLVDGEDAVLLAHEVHIVLTLTPELADELIAKAHLLGILQRLHIAHVVAYHLFELDDILKLLEEEHVDLRVVVDHHQIHLVADELGDGIETIIRTIFNIGKQLVIRPAVKFLVVDVANTRLERTHSLQERLLHRAADCHHLTRGLHLRTELVRSIGELIEGEAGDLRHNVVDRRLERCGGRSDADLIERKTYGDLGAHAGNREARSLRSKGRRTRHTGIHLDQVVLEREGVEGKLHVATTFDLQFADDLQGRTAQHLELLGREGLRRSDYHRVARVDTYGVDVLHRADGDSRIVRVAHHLKLDLLVTLDRLLDQHLVHGREEQGVTHHLSQLLLVIHETATRTTERKGRTKHNGIADLGSDGGTLVNGRSHIRRQHRLAELLAEVLEQLAVLGTLDRREARTQNLDLALLQDTLLGQLHGQVQTRLTTQTRHDGIGTLVADNLGHILQRQRLHVDLIGDVRIGHDGCRVRVHEDHLVTLLAQRQAGLRTGIVKLGSLTNHDRARADDHYFLDIFSFRHLFPSPLI